MASPDSDFRPRPSDVYWANSKPEELGAQVQSRFKEYLRELDLRGLLPVYRQVRAVHHGYDGATNSTAKWVTAGGQQGEILSLHVNQFASLVKHIKIITTAEKLEFDCVASNDSAEADAAANLGDQAVRAYQDNVDAMLVQSAEWMILYGEGIMTQLWDAHIGPEETKHVADVPEFGPDGEPVMEPVQAAPGFEGEATQQRQKTRQEVRRGGDFVHHVYRPEDVARDLGASTRAQAKWRIVLERWDRWEAASRFPEHRSYLLDRPAYDRDELATLRRTVPSVGASSHTDQINLLRLLHDRTGEVPEGLECLVCGDKVMLPAVPLPYDEMPVIEMVSQDFPGMALGYTDTWNLLGPQAALNAAASNGLTSSDAGSVPKWAIPRGSNVGVDSLGPNGRAVYYDPSPQLPNGGKPELLDVPQWGEVHAVQGDYWKGLMQGLSGINAVVRGESEGKSGADNALLQAEAVKYQSGHVRAYVQGCKRWARGIISGLKRFASQKRLVDVVGEDDSHTVQWFQGADLQDIRHVEVELGDPALRQFGMRKQIADELLEKFPQQITPEMYLAFIGTGRLEPLYKAQRNQVRLIRAENAALSKGQPVKTLVADCHLDHIREHLAMLSSPAIRMNDPIAGAILAHVADHMEKWTAMSPVLLAATGQPPSPMMGGGPEGGDEPPMEGGEPPPDAAGAPGGETPMPSMPKVAGTNRKAPQPAPNGGAP